jgi:hypothetical protein
MGSGQARDAGCYAHRRLFDLDHWTSRYRSLRESQCHEPLLFQNS